MAHNLPYMLSTSFVPKILEKIKDAKTPGRFTQDFLIDTLGFRSSAARPFLAFAKRIGLLTSDGSPSSLYKSFRSTDPSTSGAAIAEAMRKGYTDIYARNENAHLISDEKLKGLVLEETGLEASSRVVSAIMGSFKELKKFADFKGKLDSQESPADTQKKKDKDDKEKQEQSPRDVGLNIAYTINLVLPKTDDTSVFNAIFKSLRDNLLR